MSVVRTGHTSPGRYEIRVQGRLEPRWASWFDGFTLADDAEGITVISGTVIDQAALHGLLQSLRDLGLPLVSVTQPQDDPTLEPGISGPDTSEVGPPLAVPAQEDPR